MMKENIVLIGGGGHCCSVIDVVEQENKYNIIGIVDIAENIGKSVLNYKVIGCDNDLISIYQDCQNAVITVGQIKSSAVRIKLFNKAKKIGFTLPTIISPFAYVSKHAIIDEGTVVMHQALINAKASIGKNCIINTKALIEHDAIIEDNCHISTSAIINGGVVVKENTFFGSNTTSKQGVEISGFVKAGGVEK